MTNIFIFSEHPKKTLWFGFDSINTGQICMGFEADTLEKLKQYVHIIYHSEEI